MQKTFRLVVNRPVYFGNRCREGLVSPLTRSRVLSPEEAETCAMVEEDLESATGVLAPAEGHPNEVVEKVLRTVKQQAFPVFYIKPGGQIEAEATEAVEHEAPDPGYVVDPKLEADALAAHARWMIRARRGDWSAVKADLSVFEGLGVTVDPREGSDYADKVIAGLSIKDPKKRPHLTAADRVAVEEVFRRKARGLWVEGTPRTTIRGVHHDVVTIGAPVRGAPIRLKATELQLVENPVREDVLRKQLVRGNSPWGSWAFPVAAHPTGKKRRIVVDYNSRTVRAVYYLRTADSVKGECAGSVYFSLFDAVSGFNQVTSTSRAKRILAVLTASGCYLPECLPFSP